MQEILSVKDLKKRFVSGGNSRQKDVVSVVDGVSFSIKKGETLVLAGESASGKTTIARLILREIEPNAGRIILDGIEITGKNDDLRKLRMECQMIPRDPYSSIDPTMTVFEIISEPLEIHSIGNKDERNRLALQALGQVKLEPVEEIAVKYPHMLSGGQRQRVAIARCIVTNPKLIIADEPLSMLDVTSRVTILELFREIQQKLGISFLYITSDLSGARYIGHTIAIMYAGKIIESGPINAVLNNPKQPYTQALVNSILKLYR